LTELFFEKFVKKGKTKVVHHSSRESEKLFLFLNLHPTRKEFDCPDVFIAARRRAPDENSKFS
jgi:hypothetical protein